MRASGRAVIIDVSSSGASGDKFLGALVDLGGSPKSLGRVADVVERNLPGAVHGHSAKEVELHELGSADTLVDILGVAYLADELELSGSKWWSSPIAVGTGVTSFSGRTYPNPAPAVAEILRAHKFPTKMSNIQ